MLSDDEFRSHLADEHGVKPDSFELRAHRVFHITMHVRGCSHEHDSSDMDRATVLRRWPKVTENG